MSNQEVKLALQMASVVDTETTNLEPDKAEICEVGVAFVDLEDLGWVRRDQLYGTNEPIPFAASNKNNISRRMLEGKPLILDDLEGLYTLIRPNHQPFIIAHNSKYDRSVFEIQLGKSNYQEIFGDCEWICTYRLARHLIEESELDEKNDGSLSYALNYLRYALDLGHDDLTCHRAGDDAMICGLLFEKLLERIHQADPTLDAGDLIMAACEISNTAIPIKRFPFGKHKGELLEDVPTSYYDWALNNTDAFNEESPNFDPDLSECVIRILEKRFELEGRD